MNFARLKRLLRYYKQGGIYEVLLRLTASEYFPGWLVYFNEAQILRLDALETRAERQAPAGYAYVQLDRTTLDELLVCPGVSDRMMRHFREFFDRGGRCHAIKHDGGIVAYCWTFRDRYVLTYDEYRSKNVVLALQGNEVFLGNVFVAAEHRHHGVFSRLFQQLFYRYPENIRFYSWAERTNDVSLEAHARLGFTPLSCVLCVTLLGVTGYWTRAAARDAWRRVSRERLESSGLKVEVRGS